MSPPRWCSPVRREPATWHFFVVQPVSLPALNAVFINLNQVLRVRQLNLRSSWLSPHSLSPPCRPFRPQSPAVEVLSHSTHVFYTCTHLLSCSVSLYPKENLIQAEPVRPGPGCTCEERPAERLRKEAKHPYQHAHSHTQPWCKPVVHGDARPAVSSFMCIFSLSRREVYRHGWAELCLGADRECVRVYACLYVVNPSVSKPNIIFTMQSFKPCRLAWMEQSLVYIHRFMGNVALACFLRPLLKVWFWPIIAFS